MYVRMGSGGVLRLWGLPWFLFISMRTLYSVIICLGISGVEPRLQRIAYCSIHLTGIHPCLRTTSNACQQSKPDANHGGRPGSPQFLLTKVLPELFHSQEQFRGKSRGMFMPEASCWSWSAIQRPAQASESPHCFSLLKNQY